MFVASTWNSQAAHLEVDYECHDCAMWRTNQGSTSTSSIPPQFPTATYVASVSSVQGFKEQSAKMGALKDKYSVILPTYNERQNLPVLVQMLYDVFTKE